VPSWIFWLSGSLIVLSGLALLWWGWQGDRPRGRRRCPKCWHELGDIPTLVCPECGREAHDEKALARPRRRRWAVGLGLLLITGVLGGTTGYRLYNFGPWGLAPDTLLVYTADLRDMTGGLIGAPCCGAIGELDRRLRLGSGDAGTRPALAGWQWRVLGRRFADQIDHHEMHPSQLAFAGYYLHHEASALRALADIARTHRADPRGRALEALRLAMVSPDAALSPGEFVRLIQVVQRDADDTAANRLSALMLAQRAHPEALPISERRALVAWSARGDPLMQVRVIAIKLLATVGGSSDGAEELDLAAAALKEIDDTSLLVQLHQAIGPAVLSTSMGERRDALRLQVRSRISDLEAARSDPGPQ
jgi:hypothetical protein